MPAILPAFNFPPDPELERHFLPYQLAWIHDDSPLRLAEKSVRIGWTYADAFKNVRKRLLHPRRDYLFTTKDYPTALEYVRTCDRFASLFKMARSILSRGEVILKVPAPPGSGLGITGEIKVGMIRFDNGSRILAFSSNPNALRAFGGDVGMDEFAFHPEAEALWAAAAGRVTWGFDLGVWSSCHGEETLFQSFAREARTAAGRWSYYRVTLEDAIELGLVEKINRRRACPVSRDGFLEECRRRARLPEVFEQEYLCQPRGGLEGMVPWAVLAGCQADYELERWHLEAAGVEGQFGAWQPGRSPERERRIQDALGCRFARLFASPGPHRIGFDVAASGSGDLAALYVDQEDRGLWLRGLFTCRTQDWHFLKTVLATFLQRLPAATAAGDETGLGRQICWEAAREFPGRFQPVNFRSEKPALGFALMHQLSLGEKHFPRAHPDIAADFFSLQKTWRGGHWVFTESANSLNPASHGDIAWSGALSTRAAGLAAPPGRPRILENRPPRAQARRERSAMG